MWNALASNTQGKQSELKCKYACEGIFAKSIKENTKMLLDSEKTYCYTYFSIESDGEIRDIDGSEICDFFPFEGSCFDPDEITEILEIRPFKTQLMGNPLNEHKTSRLSSWNALKQEEPSIDAEIQCLAIVHTLKPHISQLLEIKRKYNVNFTIIIVPHIYNEVSPVLFFNKEIIEFCYQTGTEISIDTYVYNEN